MGRVRERRVVALSNSEIDDDPSNIKTAVKAWFTDESAAKTKYGDIVDWDTSRVTDMSYLFQDNPSKGFRTNNFNSDISKWVVAAVTTMMGMFEGATNFNSDLSNWLFCFQSGMWAQ